MRRIALLFLLLFGAAFAFAQVSEIHYLENANLAWEEVTTDIDGNPLLSTDVVTYEAYIYDSALVIDDQIPANLISVGEVAEPTITIDFAGLPRVMYYAGVRVKVVDGTGGVTTSDIAWSYDPVAVDPTQPFAYIPLGGVLVLPLPTGLREAGM